MPSGREERAPNAGAAVCTAPRSAGIVETKIDNLLAFMNDDEQFNMDPLIKMAIGHMQFEAIHPFRDGDGRAARQYLKKLTDMGILEMKSIGGNHYFVNLELHRIVSR